MLNFFAPVINCISSVLYWCFWNVSISVLLYLTALSFFLRVFLELLAVLSLGDFLFRVNKGLYI